MAYLHPGRHDSWRTDEWRIQIVFRGGAAGRTAGIIAELVDTGDGKFGVVFLGLEHMWGLGHAGVSEAIKDVNAAGIVRSVLKHWVYETRDDVVDPAQEQE